MYLVSILYSPSNSGQSPKDVYDFAPPLSTTVGPSTSSIPILLSVNQPAMEPRVICGTFQDTTDGEPVEGEGSYSHCFLPLQEPPMQQLPD